MERGAHTPTEAPLDGLHVRTPVRAAAGLDRSGEPISDQGSVLVRAVRATARCVLFAIGHVDFRKYAESVVMRSRRREPACECAPPERIFLNPRSAWSDGLLRTAATVAAARRIPMQVTIPGMSV